MALYDRYAMYDALARHMQAYPVFGDGTPAARIADIITTKDLADIEIKSTNVLVAAADKVASDLERIAGYVLLKPIWERELAEEIAGFNRPEVITELQYNISLVPVV